MERNDAVKEGEEHRQERGCWAAAAFIQEELLIMSRVREIAISDLQAHSPIFVQMLGISRALCAFSDQRKIMNKNCSSRNG